MIEFVLNWIRSLALLRHSEVRNILGEMRLRQMTLSEVRSRHPGVNLSVGIEWINYKPDRLILDKTVSICHGTMLGFGDEINGYGNIKIGSNTWIGQYNNLRASGGGGDITIGSNCLISQFCTLVGSNHKIDRDRFIKEQGPDLNRLGVVINDDVWLGAGVAIMPGVNIGTGAVVGANSVVTKSIPSYETWAGVPAQKIGERV